MIVVDTNIISYFYLNSDYSSLAEETFKKDPIWSAPLLWRSEFRNVLTFYFKSSYFFTFPLLRCFSVVAEVVENPVQLI